ncbi:MAG: endolytic transglycosylase MltG [Bacilli bacterium]|nr:endolytic transglycosylase MltG [Bacilli bacterium]
MYLTFLSLVVIGILIGFVYVYYTAPVGGTAAIDFEVKEGESLSSLGSRLKEGNLIKSTFFYKMYIKSKKHGPLTVGTYSLNAKQSLVQIVDTLTSPPPTKTVRITFKEGKNMRYVVSQITKNLGIPENEIYAKLKDKNYLSMLKKQYWFITDAVLNDGLYYSLEGYLYPDTYDFKSTATIEDVFTKLLNNTKKKLDGYKTSFEASSYSVHQILTLASMTELEAMTVSDRKGVAGVFMNRLKQGMTLGSDVTTYYAAKIDMGDRDLYKSEITSANAYNTRSATMAGKLPIGPICNPSLSAITAVLDPTVSTYYYFVADKNKKVYFTKNGTEHNAIIAKLKKEGLWYQY